MPCHIVDLPGGGHAVVTVRGNRQLCQACRENTSTLLCDFPDSSHKTGTCSRRLCRLCAVRRGALDFCPHHPSVGATAGRHERNAALTQPTLFPEDPCQGNHHHNPESHAAFEALIPYLNRLQQMVLEYIAGRDVGATVKTVRRDLGLQHQTASARLSELRAAGLTEDTGKRHEGCQVHRISDLGRRTLAEWRRNSTSAA